MENGYYMKWYLGVMSYWRLGVKIVGFSSKANEIDSINNQEVLIYYFDCVCNKGKLNLKGDKCYSNFYFEKDKLKTEEFICE